MVKKNYLDVNVIMTFEKRDAWGCRQVIFDLKLPINKHEKDAVDFINKN